MLAIDRINKIMEILEKEKSIMVSDLSEEFGVAKETIRRDLEKLEEEKKIVRVHGGAYLFEGFEKGAPSSLRKEFMIEEKEQIGSKCLEYIEEKDIIMLDNSTTSLYIAKKIKESSLDVVVITYYLDIMDELADAPNVKLVGLGGTLNKNLNSFRGPMTIDNLLGYYATKSFVSCSMMSPDLSFTDYSEHEGYIRKIMLNNAETTFMVLDHTKVDGVTRYKFGDVSNIDYMIIDKVLDKDWEDRVKAAGVNLIKLK